MARAAGLLFAACLAFAGSGVGPAQADCIPNPATADGQSIVCNGTSAAFDGGAFNNLNVNVQSGTVTDGAIPAINLNNGNLVINNGVIQATSIAGIAFFDNNNVTNNGTINVNVGFNGIGIWSQGTNNVIVNNNTVNVLGAQDTGISGGTSDTITNNATINVQAGASQGVGILGFGGGSDVITNAATGLITAGADSSAGILSLNDNITNNNGTIIASGQGSFGMAVAGTSTNNGRIVASGDAAGGVGGSSTAAMLVLSGTGTNSATGQIVASGLGAIGLGAASLIGPATAINNGMIVASGDSALGMAGGSPFGANPTLINNGTVIASGPNSVAVAANGNYVSFVPIPGFGLNPAFYGNADFVNNGLIQATGTNAFAIRTDFGGVLSVVNNGTIDGRILIDFAGFGPANSLINNGLITKSTGPFAESVINGDFTQTAGGTYAPRVSPDTTTAGYDRLRVEQDGFGGSVPPTLGGTLRAVVQPGLYAQTQTYKSVFQYCTCSSDELTTRFANVVSTSPFLAARVVYSDNIGPGGSPVLDGLIDSADLILTRIGFGSMPGETRNQQAVGNALESVYSTTLTGAAATFFSNLFVASSAAVFDQISGEGTAALQNASFGAGSQFNYAALNQLVFGDTSGTTSIIIPAAQYAATPKPRGADAFASVLKAPPAPATQTGRWRLWTAGFGGYRTIDGNALPIGSANQTIRNYGGAFGFDYQAAPDLLVGFAAGGSEANVSVPDRSTTGRLTGGHLGVYGLKTWGATYLAASANYARFDNSTTRTIAGVGPTENATGDFASDQLSARLELGWKRAFANTTLTPFVAIEPAALWSHGYTETSTTVGGAPGVLGLAFAPRTTTSLPTFLGVQADTRIVFVNGAVVSPYARASWVHEFEPSRQITATFVSLPAGAFTVDGARPAHDSGRLDAGSKVQLDTTRSLFANVSGEWSGISQSYSATAGLKVALQ